MIDRLRSPEPEDWPRCPVCNSGRILVGGLHFSCLSCSNTGPASVVSRSLVSRIARTRISIQPNGSRPVLFFNTEGRMGSEDNMVLLEKSSRLTRRWIHQDVIASVCSAIESRDIFIPMAVSNHFAEDDLFVTTLLDSQIAFDETRRFAQEQDVCSTFWIEDSRSNGSLTPNMCFPKRVPSSGFLMICTHFYGAPSLVSSIEFKSVSAQKKSFKKRVFSDSMVQSWCRQPIQWSIVPGNSSNLQVRWLSVRDIPAQMNVNACVYEDLDKGPFASFSIQNLRNPDKDSDITTLPCETCEDGIRIAREKIREIDDMLKSRGVTPDISFDKEWGIEEMPARVIMEIRSSDFWKKHSASRP